MFSYSLVLKIYSFIVFNIMCTKNVVVGIKTIIVFFSHLFSSNCSTRLMPRCLGRVSKIDGELFTVQLRGKGQAAPETTVHHTALRHADQTKPFHAPSIEKVFFTNLEQIPRIVPHGITIGLIIDECCTKYQPNYFVPLKVSFSLPTNRCF